MSWKTRLALWLVARGSSLGDDTLDAAVQSGDVEMCKLVLETYRANPTPPINWVWHVVRRVFEVKGGDTLLWYPPGGIDLALDELRPTFEPACVSWLAAPDAIGELDRYAKSEATDRIHVAVLALGYYRSPAIVDAIVPLLERWLALTQYGTHPEFDLVCALVATFAVVVPAAKAIATVTRLDGAFPSKPGHELYFKLLTHFEAIDQLRREATDNDRARRELAGLAKKHGDEILTPIFDDPMATARFVARRDLPTMTDAAQLRALLAFDDEEIRLKALERLAAIGAHDVAAIIAELARATTFPTVAQLAELALRAGDRAAIDPLTAALAKPHMTDDPKHESLVPAFGTAMAVFDTPHARALVTKNRLAAAERVEAIIYELEHR